MSIDDPNVKGRTIQLYLADGIPNGLVIASLHGWTGSVLVASQSTFSRLLARPEIDKTGIYILFGPDPDAAMRVRAYIGEADSVRSRIDQSAAKRGFWETAIVITTSDDALTKGHVRYLEARLLSMAKQANRVILDNEQLPDADRRRLPEADRANMEAFLANVRLILPVIGLELLKPQPSAIGRQGEGRTASPPADPRQAGDSGEVRFEVRHGVKAFAVEEDGEFIVLEGSEALKDTDYAHNSYAALKKSLIESGVLQETPDRTRFVFKKPYAFRSPSAAGSTILDRNTNGRTRWHVVNSDQSYHEWQENKAEGGAD
jgi:hypothetical protein